MKKLGSVGSFCPNCFSGAVIAVLLLQTMINWKCVSSSYRPSPYNIIVASPLLSPLGDGGADRRGPQTSGEGMGEVMNGGGTVVMRRSRMLIGSRPPNCAHRCYGCVPCEPTQVPTKNHHATSNTHKPTVHNTIQYTNYEPEGWKCKCGASFYSP